MDVLPVFEVIITYYYNNRLTPLSIHRLYLWMEKAGAWRYNDLSYVYDKE